MPLTYPYAFWFSQTPQRGGHFEDSVKQLGSFDNVDEFWEYFSHMAPAGDLASPSDYHLFKQGIKPMWEDDANAKGGRVTLKLRKGLSSRFWEKVVLALIGEQFDVGNEICGAVIQIRHYEDTISIWNRNASRTDMTNKIKATLQRVLSLPASCVMEYTPHGDKSSFRNTEFR